MLFQLGNWLILKENMVQRSVVSIRKLVDFERKYGTEKCCFN